MPLRMPPMSCQCAMQVENATMRPLWNTGMEKVRWFRCAPVV